jgi:phosphoglycerol transferase MdoB-like AlkP superfamily enzyme
MITALCIVSFCLFLLFYIAYFICQKKKLPWAKYLIFVFLLSAATFTVLSIIKGKELFGEVAPTQAKFIAILLCLFLACPFYYPFAKKTDKRLAIFVLGMFFLSGAAFLADAISISYAMISEL